MSSRSRRALKTGCLRSGGSLRLTLALALVGCGRTPPTSGQLDAVQRVEVSEPHAGAQRPYQAWLASIGSGPSQTERTCARGAADRVTASLCKDELPEIHGFEDLYAALGLLGPEARVVAGTTHSLGLSARSVSGANPRIFVFDPSKALIPYDRLIAVSFARGEQLVELVALDTNTLDYNFYLLHFEQACNAARCTPEDLLTEKVESGWVDWTLYADADLEDTPLDCLSCHRPFGGSTHKQLLMRQVMDPWLHWGGFEGEYENTLCFKHTEPDPGRWIPAEGLQLIGSIEGDDGKYAGIPVRDLVEAKSGDLFSAFLVDAELTIRASPYQPSDYPYGQVYFASRDVLCERVQTGTSPSWDQARQVALSRGLPVPYYGYDVMDPSKRQEITADRGAFLAKHADEDAFDVAMGLLGDEVSSAVGFTPLADDDAPQMLRSLCVRCHSDDTDPRLNRARFNAEHIDSVEPETARAIRNRISLPRTSPLLMPPLRVGRLPEWAIQRIGSYLGEHCSEAQPGACD